MRWTRLSPSPTLRRLGVFGIFLAALAIGSVACGTNGPVATRTTGDATAGPDSQLVASSTPVPPTPSPTSTPDPRSGRTLVVCLGEEPATLFPYGNSSSAARTILQAVYDGPFDRLDFTYQATILQKMPSLSDGDAYTEPVAVGVGDTVVDSGGNLVTLTPGTRVRPSGCFSESCAVDFNGSEGLSMDQMVASFQLLPGLSWSDGSPLTAADSVYSFHLAAAPESPGSKFKTDRTASYQALDELTLEWRGIPGFVDPLYMTNFWTPLPEHLWGTIEPSQLPTSEAASRMPLSYGPYVIEEWAPGDHIRMRWNQHYFRAGEGLPKFENLIFRFLVSDPQASVDQLLSGECDVLDRSTRLMDATALLQDLNDQGKLILSAQPNLDLEQVTFGIVPASFDDGFNGLVDRPDFFGDPRTRQAIAMCMDREAVIQELFQGLTVTPSTYVPPQHPLAAVGLPDYPYDPEAGSALLEEAGWLDVDGDPQTPRLARGVTNVPFDTTLSFSYLTPGDPERMRVAQILTQSMSACGIEATPQVIEEPDIYASGPDGPLFGRQFDMGQFAWRVDGEPACFLYRSDSVPGEPGALDDQGQPLHTFGWGGWNLSGYRNPAFDTACDEARVALPGSAAYQENHAAAQRIFAEDLPAVPLYMHLNLAAVRPDFCGFHPDPTAVSDLWNLETLDIGDCVE